MQSKLELLDRLTKLVQERSAFIERMAKEITSSLDVAIEAHRAALERPPEVDRSTQQQARQEQRDRKILRIWADLPPITRLTREKIARLLGLQLDNGWLGKHLSGMVKRGVLANDLKKTGVGGFYPVTTN